MTVKVEKIEGGIPHNTIMVAGLIASVILIYLTYANVLTGTAYFSFFGGLATVAALTPIGAIRQWSAIPGRRE